MTRPATDEILDALRSAIGNDNLVRSCGGQACPVDMAGIPSPRVIVDADRAWPAHGIEGGRCDRLLFVIDDVPRRLMAVPIELKSGGVDASAVARQLQTGADFVDRFVPVETSLTCRPILIHGRGLDRTQRKTLNRAKVRFRGRDLTIVTARCGRPKNLARVIQLSENRA